MKESTKRNIKDVFEDIALVFFCIMFVASLKQGCSRMTKKIAPYESESIQNAKDSVANYVSVYQKQKTR